MKCGVTATGNGFIYTCALRAEHVGEVHEDQWHDRDRQVHRTRFVERDGLALNPPTMAAAR